MYQPFLILRLRKVSSVIVIFPLFLANCDRLEKVIETFQYCSKFLHHQNKQTFKNVFVMAGPPITCISCRAFETTCTIQLILA